MAEFDCLPSCEDADCTVAQCQATFLIAPCNACEAGPEDANGKPTPDWNKYQNLCTSKVSFEPTYTIKKKGKLGTCGAKKSKVRLTDYGGSIDIEHCTDDPWHMAMFMAINGLYFAWALFPFPDDAGNPDFTTDFAFYGNGVVSGAAKEYDADNDDDEQIYTYPWASAGKQLGLLNCDNAIDCAEILEYDRGLDLQGIIDAQNAAANDSDGGSDNEEAAA